MRFRLRTLLLLVTAGAILLAAAGAQIRWRNRSGCISYVNHERIQVGMKREQVAELLGSPGEEPKYNIPHYPPYVRKPGAPPGWSGVIWGDTYAVWQDGYREIQVGFASGRVTSKHYWEPSL